MYFRKGSGIAGALAYALALGCASQKSNADSASDESFSQIQRQERGAKSQLFTSDDNSSEQMATRAGAAVDLCMIQVDGANGSVLEQGDVLVVRLTTQDASELDELRERAERMSRQVSKGSRAMAPGERATGDTSSGATDDWRDAEQDRSMAPGERATGGTSAATSDRRAADTRAVAPGERATGDQSGGASSEAAMIEDVRVEHIDNGVRLIFHPMEGQRAALRQRLQNDVAKIENRGCG